MKKFAILLAVVVLTGSTKLAHSEPRPHTRPTGPSASDLNRLHLQLGWRNRLVMAGGRDGIATVQVLGDQLLVQTRTGLIALLNAENGQILWQTRIRAPYHGQHPLGHNYNTIFGYNHTFAFGLDRANGQLKYIFDLAHVPSASPVADAERLYICLTGGQLMVYDLTNPIPIRNESGAPGENLFVQREEEPMERDLGPSNRKNYAASSAVFDRRQSLASIGRSSASQASRGNRASFTLPLLWELQVRRRLELAPMLTPRNSNDPGYVLLGSTDGTFTIGSKLGRDIVFRWNAGSSPVAPMSRHGHEAYFGLEDGSIVAMTLQLKRDLEPGKIHWRTGTGGAIEHRLEVTDEDIYATPKRRGLMRFRRDNGEMLWRAADAERFLAAAKKFVYALDRTGHLLVLDRARGEVLSRLDTRDFTVPANNDYTDRVYLASHDGQIICLHDRSLSKPLWNKKFVEDQPPHPKGKAPPEEKEMAKPKEEAPKKEAEKKEAKE